MNRRIVLIGFSATGKSAVGRRLAERLGWRFLDTDQEIVKRSGKTIAEIFHGDGEDVFRDYERKLLEEAGRRQGIVVAAGGGAVLVDRMRALMQKRFFIVCLEARPETLFQRLLKDKEAGGNPVADLLTRGDEPVDRISYLKEFRQPYYAVADWTVHTDFLGPDDVVEEIMHGWTFYAKAQENPGGPTAQRPSRYPLGDARETDAPYTSGA